MPADLAMPSHAVNTVQVKYSHEQACYQFNRRRRWSALQGQGKRDHVSSDAFHRSVDHVVLSVREAQAAIRAHVSQVDREIARGVLAKVLSLESWAGLAAVYLPVSVRVVFGK